MWTLTGKKIQKTTKPPFKRGPSPKAPLQEESLTRSQAKESRRQNFENVTCRVFHHHRNQSGLEPFLQGFYQTWSSAIITGRLSLQKELSPSLSLQPPSDSQFESWAVERGLQHTRLWQGTHFPHLQAHFKNQKLFIRPSTMMLSMPELNASFIPLIIGGCSLGLKGTLLHPDRAQQDKDEGKEVSQAFIFSHCLSPR